MAGIEGQNMTIRSSGGISRLGQAVILAVLLVAPAACGQEQAPSRVEAVGALKRAVTYFHDKVSTQGGYLWSYSADLSSRRGEGHATETQVWVQPPGTPSVGMACLRAWERTGDFYYLDVARDAAHALASGQLASGGWGYRIDFDPAKASNWHYRRDALAGQQDNDTRFNLTTFDDDTSQAALRLLMLYDQASGRKDPVVREAVDYALNAFVAMQYPCGAWPQRRVTPPTPDDHPAKRARYPETWSRTWAKSDYKLYYTLNDSVTQDCIKTMALAHEVYGDRRYQASAFKGGDFFVLAQMPEPQPAWAQQYNFEMEPVWARRFEPPCIVTHESVTAIRTLMTLYVHTGLEKYRQPIPRALDWLERSQLPDGKFARFYELKSNRPLYFNTKYELVLTDDDMPTHYAFKQSFDIGRLRRAYSELGKRREQFVKTGKPTWKDETLSRQLSKSPAGGTARVRRVIDALDDQGRWVEDGTIECSTFIRNIDILSSYIAEKR